MKKWALVPAFLAFVLCVQLTFAVSYEGGGGGGGAAVGGVAQSFTANRVPYIDSSGNWADSSNLTFSGTALAPANLQLPNITAGGILFGQGSGSNVTGSGVLTNGQILIGDNSGAPTVGSISGTSNQVVVTPGAGTITLSAPQSIGTASTPQFGSIGLGNTAVTNRGIVDLQTLSAASADGFGLQLALTVASGGGANNIFGTYNNTQNTASGQTYTGTWFGDLEEVFVNGNNTALTKAEGLTGLVGTSNLITGSTITTVRAGNFRVDCYSGNLVSTGTGILVQSPYTHVGGTIGNIANYYGIEIGSAPILQSGHMGYSLYTHQGNVVFNAESVATSSVTINTGDNGTGGIVMINASGTNITTADSFWKFNSSTATIGSIAGTAVAGTIAYNTTSDRRLKHNIMDAIPAGDIFDAMRVRSFDYNNGGHWRYGFVAQELEPIFPEAVSPGGEDPATEPWQVDYSKLVPLLVKEIQDLRARVKILEGGKP